MSTKVSIDLSPTAMTTTISGARAQSGLSRSTLLRLADKGELETRKVAGRRLIVIDSLRKLLQLDGEAAA